MLTGRVDERPPRATTIGVMSSPAPSSILGPTMQEPNAQPPAPRLAPRFAPRALLLAVVFGVLLTTGLGPVGRATNVSAGTAETMENEVFTWINNARVAKGLVPLVLHYQLIDLAGDRAATMAYYNTLSHTIAGCLPCQLTSRNIQHYSDGEAIGWSSWPWGDQAALSLFNAWKASSSHWNLLMSATYNYVGIGMAYNATHKITYSSIVLTEAIDQSRPWSKMTSGKLTGTALAWTWTGADTPLQTHTAGLKNFDLQYRIDSGSWVTIWSGATVTSLTVYGRPHGHWYGLRVLARDNRGIVSFYTAESRIWLP